MCLWCNLVAHCPSKSKAEGSSPFRHSKFAKNLKLCYNYIIVKERITTLKEYLFKYEPNKTTLAFTTLGGHLSGTLMKNINFIAPDKIAKMKEEVKEIGQMIFISDYCFVVLRKHYNTKVKIDHFKAILNNLPKDKVYKTTQEDFSELWDEIEIPDYIEIYKSSNWEDRNLPK